LSVDDLLRSGPGVKCLRHESAISVKVGLLLTIATLTWETRIAYGLKIAVSVVFISILKLY
jgi:hypothetical protein